MLICDVYFCLWFFWQIVLWLQHLHIQPQYIVGVTQLLVWSLCPDISRAYITLVLVLEHNHAVVIAESYRGAKIHNFETGDGVGFI